MSTLRVDTLQTTDSLTSVQVADLNLLNVRFPTILHLKNYTVTGAKIALVEGYYAPGDGGGGSYYYDEADVTSADNGGSIIVAVDGARWKLLNKLEVTPEQFGAKGDWNGTTGTDDSAVFVKISSHLATYGGSVLIPKRYYVRNGWVMNTSNVTVSGSGEIHSDGAPNQNTFWSTGANNVTLKGVKFTQPRTLLRGNEFAIYFVDCFDITIDGCKTDGATAGIWLNHCHDALVTNCTVNTPKADGVHFSHGSYFCKAINNTVIDAGDDSYATTFYDVGTGRPHDNQFIGNKARGGYWGFGIAVYSGDDILIQGNDIREAALGLCIVTTNAGGSESTHVTIKDNTAVGTNRVNAVPESYWFGTPDVPITSSLHISCLVLSGTSITAADNTIDQVSSPVVGAARRNGVTFNGGALINCSGNTISRVSGLGIIGGLAQLSQTNVNDNTMDSVEDVFIIFNNTPLLNSLSICNNKTGIGASIGAPNMVFLAGAGAVRVNICNNTSAVSRNVSVSTSTNVLNVNNNI